MNSRIYLLLLIGALTGCVTTVPSSSSIPIQQKNSLPAFVNVAGMLLPGEQIEIVTPELPEKVSATVGRKYHSALGLDCFSLQLHKSDLSQPAGLCQEKEGVWLLAPQVWPAAGRERK